MKKFLTTPAGSFVKVFVVAALVTYGAKLQAGELCNSIDCLKDLWKAAAIATIPVVINWLNPEYKNYGNKNEES